MLAYGLDDNQRERGWQHLDLSLGARIYKRASLSRSLPGRSVGIRAVLHHPELNWQRARFRRPWRGDKAASRFRLIMAREHACGEVHSLEETRRRGAGRPA